MDYRSQAFINLRAQFVGSQQELDVTQKRANDLQFKVSDTDRELVAVKANLSATEKGGIEAINELKSTDKLISESLKAELDRLREDYNFVVSERDAQKTQLIDALLAKDKLRKEIEEAKELQEGSTAGPVDADMSEAMRKSTEKIEKLRTRLKERKLVSCRVLSLSSPRLSVFSCDLSPEGLVLRVQLTLNTSIWSTRRLLVTAGW